MIDLKYKLMFLVGLILFVIGLFNLNNEYHIILWLGAVIMVLSLLLYNWSTDEMKRISKNYERNVRKSTWSKAYIMAESLIGTIICIIVVLFSDKYRWLGIIGLLLSIYEIPYTYITFVKRRDDD